MNTITMLYEIICESLSIPSPLGGREKEKFQGLFFCQYSFITFSHTLQDARHIAILG